MQALILLATATALASSAAERTEFEVRGLTSSTVESGSSRSSGRLEGTGWTINAPIPEPLGVAQGATVGSADGSRIYHIGGITEAMEASNRVWVYSTADDTWSRAADIPVDPGIRTFGAAVELDGFIYVFGGFDGKNILDTTWIYDETKDAWFQGATMPAPRFGSAVAIDGNVIWVAKGYQALSYGDGTNTMWKYTPLTDSWSIEGGAPLLSGRSHGVLLPSGNLHFLGGSFDGVDHVGVNIREHYSFSRPQMPYGVTDPAVASDGVRIYVAGRGGPAPRPGGRIQVFDTLSQTWSVGPLMPTGIDNTSGAIAGDMLYVVGGYDGSTPVSVNYSLPLSSASGMQDAVSRTSGDLDDFERLYDQNGWSINWPVPEGFGVAQGSTLASADGSLIYHVGGWLGLYVSNRLRVYSPSDDAGDAAAIRSPWWDAANVPLSRGIRSYGSAVELNGFIYLFGGVSGDLPSFEVLNTTWIYDEANNAWTRGVEMPGYRFGPAIATDGYVIWVIGGYNERQGPDHTVWRYDPSGDVYSTGFENMPIDLGRIHGVWLPDGTVHVFGGFEPPRINHHLVYDTLANAWSEAPDIPVGVIDPATVTDGTFIYLAGAQDAPFPRPPGYVHVFDPASGTWYQGPQMPGPYGIDNTSGTIAKGVFYVMGGSWGGGSTMSMNCAIPLSKISLPIAGPSVATLH